MGFFDGLSTMAKNAFSYDWSKTWKNLWDNGAQNVYHGFLTTAATAWNGALTPDLWGPDGPANRQRLSDALGQMGQGVGGLASGVGSLPVVRQVGEIGSWASNEVVKRPLGTFSLVAGDAANGKASLFSGDAWRQAYDDTRYSSFGQAYQYGASSVGLNLDKTLGIYDYTNPDDRAWLKAHAPWVPDWATSPDGYDPRQTIAHERYLTSPWLKYSSGSLDAAADLLADPTQKLGSLARLGKLKYWSGVMDSAATNRLLNSSDRWQGFVDSRGYQKTYDFIKANSDSPQGVEKVRQTLFNNHVNGGVMANALADVSQDPHLYALTYRALYGDPNAWDQLTQEAPRIADMTGSKYANFSISQVAKNYGVGDDLADQAAQNLTETKTQAFADSLANSRGMWGQVGKGVSAGGLLTGQTMPRLRLTSQWRVGVNQFLNYGPSTVFGNWYGPSNYTLSSVTRTMLPSSRGGRQLDLNNPDSLRIFRNNLLQSRLDQGQVDTFANMYSRASSPEARFNVVNLAENAAFKAHAMAHGVSANDVERILPELNQFRAYNRSFVQQNKRFISSDALKLAEQYRQLGMTDDADRVQQVADGMDQAVKNGQAPSSVVSALDQDGNLTFVPLDSPLDPTRPGLLSQTADTHFMQDWGALDSALWWRGKGGLGTAVWKSKEAATALADAASSVWKVAAILRPGYLWRPLTDEAGGPLSVMGSYKSIAAVTEGVKNSFWNNINRGQLAFETARAAVVKDKAARLAGRGRPSVDGEVVDQAPTAGSDLAVNGTSPNLPGYTFGGKGYQSYDHALADGLISVPDFMRRLIEHGEQGNLPSAYQAIHNSLKDGLLTPKEAQQFALDEAMRASGRSAYQSPSWQQSVIQSAIDAREGKAQGVPGRGVVVDPMSGTSPTVKSADIDDHFTLGDTQRFPADPQHFDQVYKFIHKHADALLSPSGLLHAYVQPDGNLALSVARLRAESGLDAVKPGAGVRVGIPFSAAKGKPLRASGQTGFDVQIGGQTVHILGAFEGQKGALFRRQASSKGTTEAWVDAMSDTQKARLMAMAPQQWRNVNPDDAGYDLAWERAVMQLGHDPVARQFLKGTSPDAAASHNDVVAWMHNTTDGRAYQHRLGPYLPQYYDQIHLVHGMADTYVPWNPSRPDESAALRQKVLDGTASFKDLESVVSRDDMPQVHGATLEHATGAGWFSHMVRKWTSDAFRTIGDMPNDTLLRYPLANERYQTYVGQLLQSRHMWLNGEQFSQSDLDAVQGLARDRALVDVRKYLYDSMAGSDLAKGLRLFIPFGSALYDSAAKWGTVLRENPGRISPLWRIWSAPDTNGMIQDNNGNHLEVKDGKERWFYVNPDTNEKVYQPDSFVPNGKNIVFRLPFGAPTIDGAKMGVSINKQAFQTFLDIPTFGPLVAIPANNFALSHPEWASNKFVQSFILPYGPSSNGSTAAVPGNVRNWKDAWDNFVSKDDTQNKNNQALQIWATEMVNYSQGKRQNAPTFEEARQKAAQIAGLQFISRLSGATANFTTPYQPYVDYYHMLEAKPRNPGDPTADEEFYNTMGPEYFWLTAKVTQNALGIPATLQSDQAYRKYADLMQQFPELATLIEGSEGAGVFSKAVYEAQKNTPIRYGTQQHERQLMTLDQSAEEVAKRLGWARYSQFMDALHADMSARGFTNLNQKGAEDLAANKQAYLDNNMFWTDPYGTRQVSPWFKDYSTTDASKIESRLTQMRQIVQDSRLQGRDDIRGLVDYLDARDQFKGYLSGLGIKQLSATGKKTATYSNQWSDFVFNLKETNLAFAQLYDRWLTHDDNLAAS